LPRREWSIRWNGDHLRASNWNRVIVRLVEVFESIQGEGRFAGTPSVFVRLTGCNLRCWFCDTSYTSWNPEGIHRAWQNVADQVLAFDCEHVVITGGEPLLQPDVVPLTRCLANAGRFVTVETAGTVYRPVVADLMSISPKLANSDPASGSWVERHSRIRDNRAVVVRLLSEFESQLKFVIDRPADVEEVEEYLRALPVVHPDQVWFMPQATTAAELDEKSAWVERAAIERGFRLSPRLHIEYFGNVRSR
jgi:7-carboxy-7-deazaguanine synthase